ncbi:MAG: hypothetical protein AAGI63_13560, partial [Planctomycetota bacterium]
KPAKSPLHPFDLLPNSFHQSRRVSALFRSWTTVILILLAGFFLVVVESVLTAQRNAHRNEALACEALPLWDLRETVMARQVANDELQQCCVGLESARPDDSLLQVLAGVALSTESAKGDVIVDALHVRLAVETAHTQTTSTRETLSIKARVKNAAVLQQWIELLESQARLRDITHRFDEESGTAAITGRSQMLQVEITGVPIATRVLP